MKTSVKFMSASERIGPYTQLSPLGAGTGSRVWLASAGKEGVTRLALKLTRAGDTAGRNRLLHEAEMLIDLHHPNVMRLHECGEANGITWLAMPLLSFPHATLKLGHFRQLLMGLNHLHGNDVIHCNIQPATLLLDAGVLKITNFACARRAGAGIGEVLSASHCTAPEQLHGLAVDRRADIYSAGAVLYEILTGKPAFDAGLAKLEHRILHEQPVPPSVLAPKLGSHFDALVARAMAREPADRYGSTFEFLGEFDRACRQTGMSFFA